MQEDQEIATLVVLMQHLDSARFQSFWVAADAFRSINLGKGRPPFLKQGSLSSMEAAEDGSRSPKFLSELCVEN